MSVKPENVQTGTNTTNKLHAVSISVVKRNSIDDKRPSTSITAKNSNSKPVISPRTVSMARSVPAQAVMAKRFLNAPPKLQPIPNGSPKTVEAGAKLPVASATRTVNVVSRQNDGTVILRKVQMPGKHSVVTVKQSPATQLQKLVPSNVGGPKPKRIKLDDKPSAPSAPSPKDVDPKSKSLTTATPTSSTRTPVLVRPRTAVEITKISPKQRRMTSADNSSQQQDSEKIVTLTPISASEHLYAKRTNDNEASTNAEKPSPQTPLSATEHHYSKRNSDNFSIPAQPRNRWRPTTATANVVATAADSTRMDEIKSGSTTMAPSSPILLNEMLAKIKPAIRVRSVHSLNNNTKNGQK